ncbi:hypothetical protein KKC65_00175 [Patescibacteria group bacterium]|nr:hypothetical protein [Patescibacteria group bacterium]
MEEKDPGQVLIEVTDILHELNIPYIITGGMAVLIWGRPRFTADVDIIVELDYGNVDNLTKALLMLGEASYIDKGMIKEALESEGEFNFIHGDSGIKVDFWILKKNDPFDSSRIKRKVVKSIANKKIYFSSAEDLILSKLDWYQQSQSTRHLEDIESVLHVSGKKLDMDYLNKWTKKLGFSEDFNKILNSKKY